MRPSVDEREHAHVDAATSASREDGRVPDAVTLDGVTKRFGRVTAVEQLQLVVRSGEMLSLLGPSGCGKTTTLRMIAGLEQPTGGEIRIAGRSMTGIPPHRRNLGLVPQHYAIFPHLDVFANVAFGLKMRKVAKAQTRDRVMHALDLVRLGGYADRRPNQLSGGQQQRVALARALVVEPTVLLLDEPLGALDRKLRLTMQVELKQLQQRMGFTTVFVTHDQEEALTLSDRIAVMSDGRIHQLGSPKELYEKPTSHFVADFLGTSNFLTGSVTTTDGGVLGIRTASGHHVADRGTHHVGSGDAVEISFRPEKVSLSSAEPDTVNRARGTVHSVLYQGTATHVRVRLPTGETIVAHVQNAGGAPEYGQGDQIWCSWPSDAVQVFPASPDVEVTTENGGSAK